MFHDFFDGAGSLIEHNGVKYIQIMQKSWVTDGKDYVTAKLVIELSEFNIAGLNQIMAIVSVKRHEQE